MGFEGPSSDDTAQSESTLVAGAEIHPEIPQGSLQPGDVVEFQHIPESEWPGATLQTPKVESAQILGAFESHMMEEKLRGEAEAFAAGKEAPMPAQQDVPIEAAIPETAPQETPGALAKGPASDGIQEAAFIDDKETARLEAEATLITLGGGQRAKAVEAPTAPSFEKPQAELPPVEREVKEDRAPGVQTLGGQLEGFAAKFSAGLKERFQKLAPKAQHLAEGLYANVKFNTVDHLKLCYRQEIIDFHAAGVGNQTDKINSYDRKIAMLKQKAVDGTSIAKRLGIPETPMLVEERARMQQSVSEKLMILERKREVAQQKLSQEQSRKTIHEQLRHQIADEYKQKVLEQTHPLETRMEALKPQKDQYDMEAQAFIERREKNTTRIKELEQALNAEFLLPEERNIITEAVKEAKKMQKETNAAIRKRVHGRVKIEKRMAKVSRKLDRWGNRSAEANFIMNGGKSYKEPEEFAGGEGDGESEEAEPATTAVPPNGGMNSAPGQESAFRGRMEGIVESDAEPSMEGGQAMTADTFLSRWNNYFGSNLTLNKELFLKASEHLMTEGETTPLSQGQLGKTMTEYVQLLRVQRYRDADKMSERQLEKNMKLFWKYNAWET